jgi:hypothetical protein
VWSLTDGHLETLGASLGIGTRSRLLDAGVIGLSGAFAKQGKGVLFSEVLGGHGVIGRG